MKVEPAPTKRSPLVKSVYPVPPNLPEIVPLLPIYLYPTILKGPLEVTAPYAVLALLKTRMPVW